MKRVVCGSVKALSMCGWNDECGCGWLDGWMIGFGFGWYMHGGAWNRERYEVGRFFCFSKYENACFVSG